MDINEWWKMKIIDVWYYIYCVVVNELLNFFGIFFMCLLIFRKYWIKNVMDKVNKIYLKEYKFEKMV